MQQWLFGYGSLVALQKLGTFLNRNLLHAHDYTYAHLHGYRRRWNVAMDNLETLPNYKYYIDPRTGERPDIRVTFLNVYDAAPDDHVFGIVFCLDDNELARVDLRERNYRRIDVTDSMDAKVHGRIWTYVGLDEAVDRFEVGLVEGKSCIQAAYHHVVLSAYAGMGSDVLRAYMQSTDMVNLPVRELETVHIAPELI